MTAEQWMLLEHLRREHGDERGLHEWRNLQEGRSPEGVEINATIVPGSDFIGTGRPTAEPAAVLARGNADMPSLLSLFADQVTAIAAGGAANRYIVTLTDGSTIRITLDTTHLPYVQVARSQVNTQRGEHTISLSERVADIEIRRALAHELGEILAETRSARAGALPVRQDALHGGDHTAGPLSPHDWGRVAELNLLAADLAAPGIDAARRAHVRREVGALINELGLRDGATGAAERRAALAAEGALGPEATRLMFDAATGLGRESTALDLEDQEALERIETTRTTRDEALLDADARRREAELDPLTPRPEELAGGRVPLPVQIEIARAEAEARQRKSEETLAWLRGLHAARAPGTECAEVSNPVWVGGGGGVTGLTAETLFIDARGRWQLDESPELAQTTQQVQGLHAAGMGEPHHFAGPDSRLPMAAVRAFEDHLAAQARVVNGTAEMTQGPDGRMRLTITPGEGHADRTPIVVIIGGHMTMSTGVPRERLAGEAFAQPPQQSVLVLRDRARALGHDPDVLLGAHTGATDADAAQVAHLLREALLRGDPAALALASDPAAELAMQSLGAAETWDRARAADTASGGTRVLRGDEACRTADFRTNPVTQWVIAGTGGVAISAAEVILVQTEGRTPPVTVRMMGRDSAAGLAENTQWVELQRRFGARLIIEPTRHVDGLATDAAGNVTGLEVRTADSDPQHTEAAGGVVVALGSRGLMPAVIESVVHRAQQDQLAGVPGVTVRAQTMWGRDHAPVVGSVHPGDESPGQYLGYRVIVTRNGHTQVFDVTGAQSRTLPPELFPDRDMQAVVNRAGTADAAPTSGNFAPGLAATASQARAYQERTSDGTMHTMDPAGRWL